jgi:GDP-4-dehydro-6-deoxy-D-mannose reductase
MTMKGRSALITGIAGFVGSWLAEELLAHGYVVSGTVMKGERLDNLNSIRKSVKLHELDITDAAATIRLVTKLAPQHLFHLAAMASVGQSFGAVRKTFDVNVGGTLNVLDAVVGQNKLRNIVFISSADAYGPAKPVGKLLTENDPLNPISPYGISKASAEQCARFYGRVHGVPVLIARSFNHSGPRQTDNFVIPSFCKQIALIESGHQKPIIKVGDLSAKRDISDVRDIVRGYRQLAEKGQNSETYQFCSGKVVSIDKVLQILLSLSDRKIRVETDKRRLRKADISMLRGSCRKATRELGFSPTLPLSETLGATLDYWRERVSHSRTA